ncbi:acyl-coenzyme A synthetase/AMP-(fatty) acid ligase [Azospirillum fermentarium]|uniref:AMP-binding protein n=1 Tax=Azospirillum fermentarium TaxID=1233114 RepID=UPI0022265976|nr:AMP-binding protein [Azospirillum fermentarium]MCW2247885.1 acyl-coenzyme A synthetase/AMP-(fatty) acid ligase [Azospirillum fermentarium]
MTEPPVWIDPAFRLTEYGETLGWPQLARRAGALEQAFRGGHGRAVCDGNRVATVIAALVAAERAGVELALRRPGVEIPAGVPAADGFAVLLPTSGTTGAPKLIRHGLDRLRGRLRGTGDGGARWLLTYEPASFAGLQVILTALAAGAELVAAPGEGAAGLARAALAARVTRISGTPSFWRAFLMAVGQAVPPLASITLGGEAADQPLLDRLAAAFPDASLRHVYASTEAGSLFAVADGRAGFPAAWLESGSDGVRLRIVDGILQVDSPRAMLGKGGWIDTGDRVTVAGDRVLFAGRADGRVNVGGVKVSAEEAEALILAVPLVADALVTAVPNPITGHILTAAVVPVAGADPAAVRAGVRDGVAGLVPAARPRVITLVDTIPLDATGKKRRRVEP